MSWISSGDPSTSFLIVTSWWVAHIVSFASLVNNKSCLFCLPSFWIRQGTKTRLFIFISIIVLPPKHSLSSILAPPSPRAGGLPFMTIWQGAPTTAAWFGKLLCGAVPFGPRRRFDLKLTTWHQYYLCLNWNGTFSPLGHIYHWKESNSSNCGIYLLGEVWPRSFKKTSAMLTKNWQLENQ